MQQNQGELGLGPQRLDSAALSGMSNLFLILDDLCVFD